MNTKYTPAPWRYDFEPDYCGEFIAANGESIATFADEPNEADTRLMIAAPELLEALRLCANVCAGHTSSKSGLIAALEAAKAAITKALGEQL